MCSLRCNNLTWRGNDMSGILQLAESLKANSSLTSLSYASHSLNSSPKRQQPLTTACSCVGSLEWNRIGPFQDVTLRLVAERLLPTGTPSSGEAVDDRRRSLHVYVQGELANPDDPRYVRCRTARSVSTSALSVFAG